MAIVLLVDGDDSSRRVAADCLASSSYSILQAQDTLDALRTLRHVKPDVVVLKADHDDLIPREFEMWLRADPQNESVAVIWLVPQVMLGFAEANLIAEKANRDVVLTQPPQWPQVADKIRELLTSQGDPHNGTRPEAVAGFKLSRESYELSGGKGRVLLTPTEFRLADYLMRKVNVTVDTEELMQQVWGYYPNTGNREVVRTHIKNLRLKLRNAVGEEGLIQTLPGRGYRLMRASRTST
jgi:DNA-binding response OmpR family regulator